MRQSSPAMPIVLLLVPLSILHAADVQLATDGRTDYQIVKPADPSAVDEYAARELSGYLQQITGAAFPVVSPEEMAGDRPSIFIGLSAPATRHLGQNPPAEFKEQEHVARSIGRDIFLYGRGVHGNLHAVMEFLEGSLGWRWYSVFEHPVIPSRPTVVLAPFRRRKGFSFAYRKVSLHRGMDFFCQRGINLGFDSRKQKLARRYGAEKVKPLAHFVSAIPEAAVSMHSLFSYIPPDPKARGADRFDWLERKNYFETNPEYFSLSNSGKRVKNRQLCFSNPGLRKELTRNVARCIERAGGRIILDVGAMDHPGPFCCCPGCKALEKKYGSPGGPLYDYLIELCTQLAAEQPHALIRTLAYRRSQTQKPPVLPEGQRLPDNLVIDFAPIEDCYFADWSHPDPAIQETHRDLQAWGRVTADLWAWLYPNPWGSGISMPVGNVDRLITNMRLMHRAGVIGVFTDHCSLHERGGWGELQQFLFIELARDIHCDTDALIKEFTDYAYGPAAPLMRAYLADLERARKAMAELPPGVGYRSADYNERTFPYLTTANIHRWQRLFDRMEKLLAGQPERLLINVRLVRRELDLATLWRWFDLKKAHPDYFRDYAVYADRIAAVNKAKPQPFMDDGNGNRTAWEKQTDKSMNRKARPLGDSVMRDFVTLIEAGGVEKPLPPEFDGIDRSRIRTFVPRYPNRRRGRGIVKDPDAAFGYGVPVAIPDLPFNFGFYQRDTKTHGARRAVERKEIEAGAYKVYKLGVVDVTPDCIIWFSARSWETSLTIGDRLYEPGADNHWEAYVSLKFDGPAYGGKVDTNLVSMADRVHYGDYRRGEKNRDLVLVDRVILVRCEH